MWVELLFTSWFTFHIFCLTILQRNFEYLEPLYFLSSVLVPLTFIWIPYMYDAYALSIAWCGIPTLKENECQRFIPGIYSIFILWYGPLIVIQNLNAIAIIIIVIALVYRSCGQKRRSTSLVTQNHAQSNMQALKETLPLVSYPIIFYFLTFIPLTDQIYQSTMEQANYYLIMTHIISIGLWGFFFSSTQLVHVLVNKKFRRKKKKESCSK